MDVLRIIGNGVSAIGMVGCYRGVNMLRRGIRRYLVEVKHAAAISCHFIDIQFDPFHNCFNRSLLEQGCIDACGYKGIVLVGICFHPLWEDLTDGGIFLSISSDILILP